MRWCNRVAGAGLLSLLTCSSLSSFVSAIEPSQLATRWGLIQEEHGQFIVRGQEGFAEQPLDTGVGPDQPLDAGLVDQPLDTGIGDFPGAGGLAFSAFEQALADLPEVSSVGAEAVTGAEQTILASADTTELLTESTATQSIASQRRSPIAQAPYIRGYRDGQITTSADGGYFLPVRRDLDSLLSKTDPSLVRSIVVRPGPYGLQYGPGLAYINVTTADTPRYCDGYESHLRTGFSTRLNGGQMYGRETAYGGGSDWGYIVSWGLRVGADYSPGGQANFSKIPSSYNAQNGLAQFGFDLSPTSRIEFRYNRLGQNNTEYAAQFFDINFLSTDAATVSYIVEDDCNCSETRLEAWYNWTRYSGDTLAASKRFPYPVIDRVERALVDAGAVTPANPTFNGFTTGNMANTGARLVKTYGEQGSNQLRAGVDFRHVSQRITESYAIPGALGMLPTSFNTNMPRAKSYDPGAFSELILPLNSYLTTSIGGRVDYVHTTASQNQYLQGNSVQGVPELLDQNDMLFSFYLDSELLLTPDVTLRAGGGHAQRTPNLTDRYAGGLFLAIMQSGFNRVIGTPDLRKEKAWQVDASMEIDKGWMQASLRGFHSWIDDYNLYQGEVVADPTGARILRASNAELVTLTGFEGFAQIYLTDRLIGFGSARYYDGRDRNIVIAGQPGTVDQPLFGIVPFEGRAGLRLIDACGGNSWGVEFGTRIVNGQDRIAQLRQGNTTVVGLVPLEEATPGFTTYYMRGYYNIRPNMNLVGGVENLGDKTYQEHLDLRLPAQPGVPADDPRSIATRVLAPGITPYAGLEWTY